MTAKVFRLRPKRHDTISQAVQLVLDMPLGLNESTRDDLAAVLDRHQPPRERWTFTMMSGEQIRLVSALIDDCPSPLITYRVWMAAVSRVAEDKDGVCEIMASRTRLAEDARTTPQEVSRAMNLLAELGVMLRLRPGRFAINPHVGWNGDLTRREEAAKQHPKLSLVPTA